MLAIHSFPWNDRTEASPLSMHRRSTTLSCVLKWSSLIGLIAFLAGVAIPLTRAAAASIDYTIDQKVWKMIYGVTDAQLADPAWLSKDDDGDGVPNGEELAAGTNPFDPKSKPAAYVPVISNGMVSVTFPTVPGKMYILQSSADLSKASNWTNVTPPASVIGVTTASSQTLSTPLAGANLFYRILVQDTDTDGDGVSDWAEIATGFDPNNTHTNGSSVDDHTALSNDLAAENVVTLAAVKSTAIQPPVSGGGGASGSIVVSRGGSLHLGAITVPLQFNGSAIAGSDFLAPPAFVTIPAKAGSVTVPLTPLANPSRLASVSVTLSAQPGEGIRLVLRPALPYSLTPQETRLEPG